MSGMPPLSSRWPPLTWPEMDSVAWALVFALIAFVGSIAVVTFLVVQMPADYFVRPPGGWGDRHPVLRWTLLILKNVLGAVLVVVGFVMLFVPGQGVLTILLGVALLNFPGKRALERKLVGRPGVLKTINHLRARFGKPPLILDEPPGPSGAPTPAGPAKGEGAPPHPEDADRQGA